jgi:3-isopropylmalate/(R)-2-methylmalate dehydratase small subunit
MQPFSRHRGIAVPLDAINMDTDQILPARFLRKRRLDPDYTRYLFHDLRFDDTGSEIAAFPLNRPAFRDASIIVGNTNFGGGSSREAAAFALDAYGIRCIIAPNFGDIFYSNCLKNGILPVSLDKAETDRLRRLLYEAPGSEIAIDLAAQTVTEPTGHSVGFEIEAFHKRNLMAGLSQIGLSLEHAARIDAFEQEYRARMTWL